jgi:hypothetical protein
MNDEIGMPEMLKTTSMVIGAGLGMDVACVTDGRFSGGTHGFTVGHVVPVRHLLSLPCIFARTHFHPRTCFNRKHKRVVQLDWLKMVM